MSLAKRLVSASAARFLSFLAAAVVSFALTPFVIRSLGDRAYGFWSLVGTFIGYYGLFDLGLDSAVSRHLAGALGKDDRAESVRIFGTALRIYWVLSALVFLASCLLALFSSYIAKNPEDARLFSRVILILGTSISLTFALKPYSGVLTALIRFDLAAYLDILSLIFRTALIVAVLSAGFKLLALAWVTLLAGIPSLLLRVHYARKLLPWLHYEEQPFRSQKTKSLFSYSIFTLIAQVADELRFNLDKLVITAFIGLAAVTHYSIAGILVTYFRRFMVVVLGTLQPVYSRMEAVDDYAAIKKTLLFATKLSVSLATFIGFGLVAWGKPFIERWVGPEYLDAYPSLVALTLGIIVACWQTPSVGLLYGISKHRFYAAANLLEGLANLVLSLALVRPYGIFGVALGTCIPMFISKLFAQPYYVCRVASIPFGEYFGQLLRAVLVALVSLVVPMLLTYQFVGPRYGQLVMVGLASGVSYALLTWFLQFTKREKSTLRDAIFSFLPSAKPADRTV